MKVYQAIILSLLCHSILLLPQAKQDMPEIAIAPIQVKIAKNSVGQSGSTVEAARKSRNNDQLTTLQNKHSVSFSHTYNKPLKLKTRKTTTTLNSQTAQGKTISQQQARILVLSRLHNEIDNYFYYPVLARRNGWQGKVILGLSVNAHGNIRNVHIKKGSGYRILDQSALDTLLKIRQIGRTEDWIVLDNLDIIVPVVYRLQKG